MPFFNNLGKKPQISNRDYVRRYNETVRQITQKPASASAGMKPARTVPQHFGNIRKVESMIPTNKKRG